MWVWYEDDWECKKRREIYFSCLFAHFSVNIVLVCHTQSSEAIHLNLNIGTYAFVGLDQINLKYVFIDPNWNVSL